MGICSSQRPTKINSLRTVYLGQQSIDKSTGKTVTIIGYDAKKHHIYVAIEGGSNVWYRLKSYEHWGGLLPEPQVPAPVPPQPTHAEPRNEVVSTIDSGFNIPGLPLQPGEKPKQHYWKAGHHWVSYLEYLDYLEARAQERWGRTPVSVQEMWPSYRNSPSPSRESDDETW